MNEGLPNADVVDAIFNDESFMQSVQQTVKEGTEAVGTKTKHLMNVPKGSTGAKGYIPPHLAFRGTLVRKGFGIIRIRRNQG